MWAINLGISMRIIPTTPKQNTSIRKQKEKKRQNKMKIGQVLLIIVSILMIVGIMAPQALAARGTPFITAVTNEIPFTKMMFEGVLKSHGYCQKMNEICNDYLVCCPDLVCYTRGTCGDLVRY